MINSTIAITGANGKIGSKLTKELNKLNLNFIKLNQIELLDESTMDLNLGGKHIETVIDIGWDTKNRKTIFQSACATKSINLSKYCNKKNIKYIFLSSFTAINPKKSQYGISKQFVELQLSKDSTVLRAPYVIFSSAIGLDQLETINRGRVLVPYILIDDLVREIIKRLPIDVLSENLNLDYEIAELKEVYPIIKIFRIFNYLKGLLIVIFFLKPLKRINFIGNALDRLYGLVEVDQYLKKAGRDLRNKS